MERTSRNNYWSYQYRGRQACLEGPGQAPLSIWTSFNFSYFYITSTNSLHCFLAHIARAQHISAEDGLHCPLQMRHLDLDVVQEDPNILTFLQGIGGFHITSSPPCWWTANKRSLISSFCLSTSICSFLHCYLCLPRLHENHLFRP